MVGTSQRDVHGEAAVLAREIQNLKQNAMTGSRLLPGEITADFSKGALLPRLIDGLEKLA